MIKLIIFGGTKEGRVLCEYCEKRGINTLYCTAGKDGAERVKGLKFTEPKAERLDASQMVELFKKIKPKLIIDATHPYAVNVSGNIESALRQINIPLISLVRESEEDESLMYFNDMDGMLGFIENAKGNAISAMGASYAHYFTRLKGFEFRVYLRILPSISSLKTCLDLGYPARNIICMQGPFSESLNRAMFESTDAKLLLTKDGGKTGGFPEKIRAAKSLGMQIAVLKKPPSKEGMTVDEACEYIQGMKL